jgi:hypothetical protein
VYEASPLLPIDKANIDRFTIGRFKVLGLIESATAPQQPFMATFAVANERLIQLEGLDVQTMGDKRTLTFHWLCLKQSDQDYTLFVHVLDRNGTIISQEDAQPLSGAYPTSMWDAKEQIVDRHAIELPEAATRLRIGWYPSGAPGNGSRLTAQKPDGTPWQDNAVVIGLP